MIYKILRHDEFFPEEMWLRGITISAENISDTYFPNNYRFIKKTENGTQESRGEYRQVFSVEGVHKEFIAIDNGCKDDYDRKFFVYDKV